ncbi:MAG TPA: hypothetical protein VHA56_16340 [Mucilaginibacter sp.]|nr:hypothetical protein [Mucilaginibacter sp.]
MDISEGQLVHHKLYVRKNAMLVVKVEEATDRIYCRSLIDGKFVLDVFYSDELVLSEKDDDYKYSFKPMQFVKISKFDDGPVMYVAFQTEFKNEKSYLCRYVVNGQLSEVFVREDEIRLATENEVTDHGGIFPKREKHIF